MKFKLLTLNLILVTIIYSFSGCKQETSPEDAKMYNDRLVAIQEKAINLDKAIDKEFYENYYSFYKYDDPEYVKFISDSKKRYDLIFKELLSIKDLYNNNNMKIFLLDNIQFMQTGIDSYYTELIKLPNDREKTANEVLNKYNIKYELLENKFISAQDNLIEMYGFEPD